MMAIRIGITNPDQRITNPDKRVNRKSKIVNRKSEFFIKAKLEIFIKQNRPFIAEEAVSFIGFKNWES